MVCKALCGLKVKDDLLQALYAYVLHQLTKLLSFVLFHEQCKYVSRNVSVMDGRGHKVGPSI